MLKENIHKISYAVNAILVILVIVLIFSEDNKPIDLTLYTQQDLSKSLGVLQGMSIDEVKKIMGLPVKKEITQDNEVWHYCTTGSHVDEYIAIGFSDGKVVKMTPYAVSYLDIIFKHTQTPSVPLIEASGLGDCRLMVGMGSFRG